MRAFRRVNPVVRAIAVIGSVTALVTGATYAALNSQVTLTNSSISTTSANLQIWDGDSFEDTAPGFTVTDLVPGTPKVYPFYLKNAGAAALDISAHVPTLPGAPVGSDFGFSGYDKVMITIKSTDPTCVGSNSVNTTLAELNAEQVGLPCNSLAAGSQGNAGVEATEGNYTISFDIDPDAITGSQAGVGNFDIVLTGTQATPSAP